MATCTTREFADSRGITLGTAVLREHLDEADYRETLVANFNSITPEHELKWDSIHPSRDEWNFGPADEVIAFARDHGLAVKGHTLAWEQQLVDSTPDWVKAINDPDALRAVLRDHFTEVLQRYADDVDRWDVVNEPLQTLGAALYDSHFRRVLGDDYIAWMFELAHEVAPEEQLWLNESTVEFLPKKGAALVKLVTGLVADGVPIDGVGIQGHLVTGTVDKAYLGSLIDELRATGVEVAITELDVVANDESDPLGRQAIVYGDVVAACLQRGCHEITTWGFTDRYTWIDQSFTPGLAPLPFDVNYQPKPAAHAIRSQLAN